MEFINIVDQYRDENLINIKSMSDRLIKLRLLYIHLKKEGLEKTDITKKLNNKILDSIEIKRLEETRKSKLNNILLQYMEYYSSLVLNIEKAEQLKTHNLEIPDVVKAQLDPNELNKKPVYDQEFLKIIGIENPNE